MRSSVRHLLAISLLAAQGLFAARAEADEAQPSQLRIADALVTLIEQAEIPARDAGLLTELKVNEGDVVKKGQIVGKVDDEDARLALAKAAAEVKIAATTAANDVKVRFADKAAKVAMSELKRSQVSMERVERSISKTELEKLQLEAERGELSVEEAQHDLQVARQTRDLKQAELAVAQQVVDRRQIMSPLDGVVVQLHRRRGEWVKPGDPVLRVVRIDRMRAEAFVPAGQAVGSWTGRSVRFIADSAGVERAPFVGKLVFVSPEIDPVNGQIRVWAEIENRNHELRPGERGTLELAPPTAASAVKGS
ncbi:MAG: HlyD family efflux transporter periplasmic adaptor subunit [Planctomycetia bacterium]|nr:HlyD family efflux transporter periplasmic adaptor subunit [Planctomycetia bacterium]